MKKMDDNTQNKMEKIDDRKIKPIHKNGWIMRSQKA